MTIKEASVLFNLDEKEIRKRKNNGMIIGVRKDGRAVVIPNETVIIPSKKDIQSFLLQIIRYKNNPHISLSRKICPDQRSLCAVMQYLFLRGFIGELCDTDNKSIDTLFAEVELTDEGINYIMGNGVYNRINVDLSVPLQINPSFKIGLINIA